MAEIILNLEPDLTYNGLKARLESVTREYSLAVIEGQEEGREYPEAAENIRFLSSVIFDLSCSITDNTNCQSKG